MSEGLILQPIGSMEIVHPLQLLSEYIEDWSERNVTPETVVYALGYLGGRDLKPFEERDIRAWMEDGKIGRTARTAQGEQ